MTHRLDRIITIDARPEFVFSFFLEPERWAAWWGEGSTIDAREGGAVLIRQRGGPDVRGAVVGIDPPTFLAFTYGHPDGGPIPADGSRVEIRLERLGISTRLHLTHHFSEAGIRDLFVQGWRYQLSVFANAVADRRHADAAARADAWFAAWAEPDEIARRRQFEAIAAPEVRFRDRHSALAGMDDLLAHVAAAQRFMPGVRLTRSGAARQCQGMALVDWTAAAGDQPRGSGTNVFEFDADGRITGVVGLWGG